VDGVLAWQYVVSVKLNLVNLYGNVVIVTVIFVVIVPRIKIG
jgi:hypothetical protein